MLHVSNVDPSSLACDQQPHSVHLRFQSLGTGYFPQHYAFYLRLPPTKTCTIKSVHPEVWDNDVSVQLELVADDNSALQYYEVGLDEADALQRFECERPSEDVFEDAEDGDTFAMDSMTAALPTFSPQKMKQRSYSESNCDDFHDADMDGHGGDREDDDEEEDDDEYGALVATKNGHGPSSSSSAKDRTYSECSADDGATGNGGGGGGGKCLKGILKRRSSSMLSESQSSFDEPCSRSVEMAGSEHSKKSVRFDNNIRKLLFRLNSTVAGQRKPKVNKRKKKKRCTERRYSEGEASDYDPKSGGDAAAAQQQPKKAAEVAKGASKSNGGQHMHDSGVDLRENSDLQFKNGMIFELDM